MYIIEEYEYDEVVKKVKEEALKLKEYETVDLWELDEEPCSTIEVDEDCTIYVQLENSHYGWRNNPAPIHNNVVVGICKKIEGETDGWGMQAYAREYMLYEEENLEDELADLFDSVNIFVNKNLNQKMYISQDKFNELVEWAQSVYPEYEGENAYEGWQWKYIPKSNLFLMFDWRDGYDGEYIEDGEICDIENRDYRLSLSIRVNENQYFQNDNQYIEMITFNKNTIEDDIKYLLSCCNIEVEDEEISKAA